MKFPPLHLLLAATIFSLSALAGPATALDPKTEAALLRALDDERHAQAIYQAVIHRHGEVRPFANIVHAEQRHTTYLLELFKTYNVAVPANPWLEQEFNTPDTLREACSQAHEAEKANIHMYDELLEVAKEPDIHAIFTRLRNASREHHLPAFERCASRRRQRP